MNKISFNFEHGECLLAIFNDENQSPLYSIDFKQKQWVETSMPFWTSDAFYRAVCYGEWNHEEFNACIWHYETPVNTKFKFTFSEDRKSLTLHLETPMEVSLNFVRI
jgi:hypothetical protein